MTCKFILSLAFRNKTYQNYNHRLVFITNPWRALDCLALCPERQARRSGLEFQDGFAGCFVVFLRLGVRAWAGWIANEHLTRQLFNTPTRMMSQSSAHREGFQRSTERTLLPVRADAIWLGEPPVARRAPSWTPTRHKPSTLSSWRAETSGPMSWPSPIAFGAPPPNRSRSLISWKSAMTFSVCWLIQTQQKKFSQEVLRPAETSPSNGGRKASGIRK